MGHPSASPSDLDDPFVGCPPQPVRCRWLTDRDAHLARSAEIIRLVVDDQRGHCDAWANAVYQRHFLRDVRAFIGATNAVLVTYAGTLTAYIPPLAPTVYGLNMGLTSLQDALTHVDLRADTGPREILLGLDGCLRGQATHLQTIVHLSDAAVVSLANTAVKLYPSGAGEQRSLIGWQLCEALGQVPDELAAGRRARTAAGTVLLLVCNDAAMFSGRSRARLSSGLKLRIRQHFLEQAQAEPRPSYVLLATHWQGTNPDTGHWSGEAFRQSAAYLSEQTGATVVTTLRAPECGLALAAQRFSVRGSREDKVATLLVHDTFEQTNAAG